MDGSSYSISYARSGGLIIVKYYFHSKHKDAKILDNPSKPCHVGVH